MVIYAALAASWPLCGSAYAYFLRQSGKVLFEAVGPRDQVRIGAYTAPDGKIDTVLFVRGGADGQAGQSEVSSWLIGFQPTSLLIGLVLATPVSMSRRLWALFAGLVMVHAFVLARLTTFVILAPLAAPDTLWMKALGWFVYYFTDGRAGSYLVPVLIWLAVTVRREDARRLVPSSVKDVCDINASRA